MKGCLQQQRRFQATEKLLENDKHLKFFSLPCWCVFLCCCCFWGLQVKFIAVIIECWVKWVKSSFLLSTASGTTVKQICIVFKECRARIWLGYRNSQGNRLPQGCICLHHTVWWRISLPGGIFRDSAQQPYCFEEGSSCASCPTGNALPLLWEETDHQTPKYTRNTGIHCRVGPLKICALPYWNSI